LVLRDPKIFPQKTDDSDLSQYLYHGI
jgi:hypothetical protein